MECRGKEGRPKKPIERDSIYAKFKSKRGNIKPPCLGMHTQGLTHKEKQEKDYPKSQGRGYLFREMRGAMSCLLLTLVFPL